MQESFPLDAADHDLFLFHKFRSWDSGQLGAVIPLDVFPSKPFPRPDEEVRGQTKAYPNSDKPFLFPLVVWAYNPMFLWIRSFRLIPNHF